MEKEEIKKMKKEYYIKNRDKIRKYQSEYYKNNREKILQKLKDKRNKNVESQN